MSRLYSLVFLIVTLPPFASAAQVPSQILSLDGTNWQIAKDPGNVGQNEKWFEAVRPDVKPIRVPWILEDAFPDYDGVVWYYKKFETPSNPHQTADQNGRTLLRFWTVEFKADVWLNGKYLGGHEGSETPFTLDATDAIKPGVENLLVVRVLNPGNGPNPADGIRLNTTPRGLKTDPHQVGLAFNHGGILDSVELLSVPAARVDDIFAKADPKTGEIHVETSLFNAEKNVLAGVLEISVAPARSGSTICTLEKPLAIDSGENHDITTLKVENHRLWELNDPYLYRVTVRLKTKEHADSFDEQSVKTGFREFVFRDGYFRLNGRRIFLKCAHTCNHTPIGLRLPHDQDLFRRDMINSKMMGLNAVRFIAGMPTRYQLDLADELGLMVYEECYAAWMTMEDSPQLEKWFDDAIRAMILRDRNHPSVVIWGLLNECSPGKVSDHAASVLDMVRSMDDTRMVLYSSGRWDLQNKNANSFPGEIACRCRADRLEPFVAKNESDKTIKTLGIVWESGRLATHPGPNGEYGVIRWTAPTDAKCHVTATFDDTTEAKTTTDVHVLHNGKSLFAGFINIKDGGTQAKYDGTIKVKKGDTLDFAVGQGNESYGGDTTALDVIIKADSETFDAAKDFTNKPNHDGPWTYGQCTTVDNPQTDTFTAFDSTLVTQQNCGTFSNPGSKVWDDSFDDHHPYQRVPHTADIISFFRTVGEKPYNMINSSGGAKPYFPSEYGIGSGVNWPRAIRLFEQLGNRNTPDRNFYQVQLDSFMKDYQRWKMEEVFGYPEAFFKAGLLRMAEERTVGLNAIRSNPSIVGYSLTGLVDQVMGGEGLWTTFRELKPGTTDAIFDGFAPLRWCTFVEPLNTYTDDKVTLDIVLANEDALKPGTYPAQVWVFGPNNQKVYEKSFTVTIPEGEPSFAIPVFKDQVQLNGPSGQYRMVVQFEKGAAAMGGETRFYRLDRAEMPSVKGSVVLWGEDPKVESWLKEHGVSVVKFDPAIAKTEPQTILAVGVPVGVDPDAAFADLIERIENGSYVVFLTEQIFRKGNDPTGYLPLEKRGTIGNPQEWLYHVDQWAKRHPVFEGLQSGGLMGYDYYREILPLAFFIDTQTPDEAIAGGNNASLRYESGLMLALYHRGKGQFLINTLLLRENLGTVPQAERLLRNLLRLPQTTR